MSRKRRHLFLCDNDETYYAGPLDEREQTELALCDLFKMSMPSIFGRLKKQLELEISIEVWEMTDEEVAELRDNHP